MESEHSSSKLHFHNTRCAPDQTNRQGVDRHKLLETTTSKRARPRKIETPLKHGFGHCFPPGSAVRWTVESAPANALSVSCILTARTNFLNNKCYRENTHTMYLLCSHSHRLNPGPGTGTEGRLSPGGRGRGGARCRVHGMFFSDGNIILIDSFLP